MQVNYCSIAHNAGLRTKDYIVEVNGSQVFGMNHDDCKNLIKRAGDHVVLRVERGDFIVPNMDEAFPKKKEQQVTVSELDGPEQQVRELARHPLLLKRRDMLCVTMCVP